MRDRDFERFAEAVETCSELMKAEIREFIGSLDLSKKKASRDALLVGVPAIVEKYGLIASEAAAEYYELARKRDIGGEYQAKVYPMSEGSRAGLLESIRYACGCLFDKESVNDG